MNILREVHAVELPYPTTCYTGARTPFRFDYEATDIPNSDGFVALHPQSATSGARPEEGSGGAEGGGEGEGSSPHQRNISGVDEEDPSIVRGDENLRGRVAGRVAVVARLAAERNSVEFAFYRPPPPPPSRGRGRMLLSAEGEFRTTVRRLPRVATAGRRTKGGGGAAKAAAKRQEDWACVAHDCCAFHQQHVEVFAIRRPPTQQQTTSGVGGSSSEHNQEQHREGGGGRAAPPPQQREDDGSSVTAASAASSVSTAVQKPSSSGAAGGTLAPAGTMTAASPQPDGRSHAIAGVGTIVAAAPVASTTTAEARAAPHDGKATNLDSSSSAATSSSAVTPTRRNSGQSAVVDQTTTTNDKRGGGGGTTATGNFPSDACSRPPTRNGASGDGGGGDHGSMSAEAYLVVRRGGGARPPTPASPPDEVEDREEGKGDRQRASGGGDGVGGDVSKRRSRHGTLDQIIPVPFQPIIVRLTRFFHGGRGHSVGVSSSSSSSVAGLIVGSSDAVAPLRIYLPNGATGCYEECTIVDGGRSRRSRVGSIDDGGGGDTDGDQDRGEGEGEHYGDFGEEDRTSFLPPPPPSPQPSSSSQGSSDHQQHPATGSPVMALDACHDADDGVHYLAVGYQNGCIRVVAYRLPAGGSAAASAPPTMKESPASKSSSTPTPSSSSRSSPVFAPTVLRACTFLVDGPVVSLCLRLVRRRRRPWRPGRSTTDIKNTRTSSVHLVAGSLCGFACSFVREVPPPLVPRDESGDVRSGGDDGCGSGGGDGVGDDHSSSYSFRGPFVVTEGLRWTSSGLEGEDGVLVVSEFAFGATRSGTCVAVGTHSGRVLLFEPVIGGSGCDDDGDGGEWERGCHERLDTSAAADDGEVCDDAEEGVADVGGDPEGGGCGRRRRTPTKLGHRRYRLFWTIRLPYPIHGIASADLDGDGLPELLVTTRKSLHVFRMDVTHLANVVKMRLDDILRLR